MSVDVLAIMDRIATAPISDTERRQMAEARAAIAEVFDALDQFGNAEHVMTTRLRRLRVAISNAVGESK